MLTFFVIGMFVQNDQEKSVLELMIECEIQDDRMIDVLLTDDPMIEEVEITVAADIKQAN